MGQSLSTASAPEPSCSSSSVQIDLCWDVRKMFSALRSTCLLYHLLARLENIGHNVETNQAETSTEAEIKVDCDIYYIHAPQSGILRAGLRRPMRRIHKWMLPPIPRWQSHLFALLSRPFPLHSLSSINTFLCSPQHFHSPFFFCFFFFQNLWTSYWII